MAKEKPKTTRKITPHPENLKPIRDSKRASELGRLGGLAKAKKDKEKKLLSSIYSDFFAKKYNVMDAQGKATSITGEDIIHGMIKTVLLRADSVSVSLLEELRVGTEGDKLQVTGLLGNLDLDSPENKTERDRFARELKNIYNIDCE